jgi:hypothetical protein
MSVFALLRSGAGLLGMLCGASLVPAAVFETLTDQIRRSDFVFGRTDGNAPFPPVAWLAVQSYGESELTLQNGPVRFDELAASEFLLLPVWVGKKDMVLVGEYAAWQRVDFTTPLPAQRDLYTVIPILAWLHQITPRGQIGAFIAPEFVQGGDYAGHEFTEWSGYAGVIGLHWRSESFAWVYGGVAAVSRDSEVLLPYLGCIWLPNPTWSVTFILPWPSMAYAPTRDFMLQLGMSPADGILASTKDGRGVRLSYSSWSLQFLAHHRLAGEVWLSAGVGWSGLGSFTVESDGNTKLDRDLSRGLMWSVQISLRPPTKGPARPAGSSATTAPLKPAR